MPWTFAHPAAILPLRSLCPRWLCWPGLILGAMAPDLSYYIGMHGALRAFCHTPAGVVSVCLPACLLLLGLMQRWPRPLTVLLPEPHRSMARDELQPPPQAAAARWAVAALSILLGAATHLLWDLFTHPVPQLADLLPWLEQPALTVMGRTLTAARLLQYLSSVAGALVLAVAYARALRRRPARTLPPDPRRTRVLWACLATALAVGALSAWALTPDTLPGYPMRRLVRAVVWSTSCFTVLFVAASALWWRRHGDA
ncbi:DUF4184 family protein [Roseateles sp. BYS78W]|uniref:DUF4184 family protein n=1 Tax=Pelomonas candidula TaxID=3299025 RepID=A0ABW7H9N2_9BURK